MYTFRKSINSTFPEINSDEAINSLEMIKKIMVELSVGKIPYNNNNK